MNEQGPPEKRSELPAELKVEVKTSRSEKFALSKRDLKGIKPDGFAAILVGSARHGGPRWILVEARRLAPGTHDEAALLQAEQEGRSPAPVVEAINRTWSNWILDPEVRRILFQQHNMALKDAVKWVLGAHPPRENRTPGSVRQMKVGEALKVFRRELDEFLDTESGPQQEGQVHQYVLEDAVRRLGYDVTNNPIGVPDFNAVLRQTGVRATDNGAGADRQEGEPEGAELARAVKRWLTARRPVEGSAESFIDQVLQMSDDELGAEISD